MKRAAKSLSSVFGALLITVVWPSSAHAAWSGMSRGSSHGSSKVEALTERPVSAVAHRRPTWVIGNIIAVNRHAVAINTENGRMRSLALNARTKVLINGKRGSARDLERGDLVLASYEGNGSHAKVSLLQVNDLRGSTQSGALASRSKRAQGATAR